MNRFGARGGTGKQTTFPKTGIWVLTAVKKSMFSGYWRRLDSYVDSDVTEKHL
jgi:hypothetical protein